MQKSSTMRRTANKIFQGRQLTIGMDLGDRWSFYCVLEESGKVILEEKLATTPEAMKQTFARISPELLGPAQHLLKREYPTGTERKSLT
jgi:hypothetical protein